MKQTLIIFSLIVFVGCEDIKKHDKPYPIEDILVEETFNAKDSIIKLKYKNISNKNYIIFSNLTYVNIKSSDTSSELSVQDFNIDLIKLETDNISLNRKINYLLNQKIYSWRNEWDTLNYNRFKIIPKGTKISVFYKIKNIHKIKTDTIKRYKFFPVNIVLAKPLMSKDIVKYKSIIDFRYKDYMFYKDNFGLNDTLVISYK
jgi:hypothetical protein